MAYMRYQRADFERLSRQADIGILAYGENLQNPSEKRVFNRQHRGVARILVLADTLKRLIPDEDVSRVEPSPAPRARLSARR